MTVHYAGCCHALPGDRIVGIVTTGKGRHDPYQGLPDPGELRGDPRALHRRRLGIRRSRIGGKGGGKASGPTWAASRPSPSNGPNALAPLTNAVAKQEGVVSNLKIVNRQQDFFEVLVDVEVRDLRHLSTVIAGLRAAGGDHPGRAGTRVIAAP